VNPRPAPPVWVLELLYGELWPGELWPFYELSGIGTKLWNAALQPLRGET